MKPEPVTKRDKKIMATLKKTDDDFMPTNYDVITFFRLMTGLQQSGSRILGTWSAILTFSLITAFYPTKYENKTKRSLI